MKENKVIEINDEVYLWLEQESSIMLKAVTKSGDPVELTGEEAVELSRKLAELSKRLGK